MRPRWFPSIALSFVLAQTGACVTGEIQGGSLQTMGGIDGDAQIPAPGDPGAEQSDGSNDDAVSVESGREARDAYLAANGCSTSAVPVDPDPCVSYEGCDDGYPVVWCEDDSGHNPQGEWGGASAWGFLSGL